MPPQLRNGKPVQQRRFVPATMVDCHCTECEGSQYFDLSLNKVLCGQRVTMLQHKKHRQQDERRQLALANYNAVSSDRGGTASQPSFTAHTPSNGATPASRTPEPSPSNNIPRTFRKRLRRPVKGTNPPNKSLARLQISRQVKQGVELLHIVDSDKFQQGLKSNPLVFAKLPGEHMSIPPESSVELIELDALAPSNHTFIQHQNALSDSLRFFDQLISGNMSPKQAFRVRQLKPQLREEQRKLSQVKRECWEQQWKIAQVEKGRIVDTSGYYSSLRGMEPISCLVYLLAATLHLLANLSLGDLRFLLPCLGLLLKLALRDSPNPDRVSIVNTIPSDVRTVIASLPIEPKFTALVCCSTCFSTYTFDPDDSSSYPEFCEYQDITGGSLCGRRLQKKLEPNITLPARQFLYQSIQHWIGRMYSRPEIEKHLNRRTMAKGSEAPNEMSDIWDASILRDFLGPDGRHFMDKPDAEGRLIFGLNMDGFNLYGNKRGGKHVSICGVYLVCFNLPIELRYQAENVFLLGVVPGPTEPATHQVNHILRPLVDDLLSLWSTGMYLTKTTQYPLGRPVRCALVPIICDLPAARRVAGLGGHSSGPFCSECLLHLSNINELDRSKWTPRCYNDHCFHAQKWRDAKSQAERTRIFQAYGAKWSELLRLPYWDPTKFVVIDSMHGFYLRIFHRHIRDVWGMDIEVDDGNGMPDLNLSDEDLSEAQHALRFGKLKDLQELKKTQLKQLCREAGLHYGGRRSRLIKLLLKYRIKQGWFQKDGTLIPQEPVPVTGGEDVPQKDGSHENPGEELSTSPNFSAGGLQPPALTEVDPSPPPTLTEPFISQVSLESNLQPSVLSEDSLEDLYLGAKSRIARASKDTLVALCCLKLKGKKEDYTSMGKDAMTRLLHESRDEAGIIPVRRTRRTARVQHMPSPAFPDNNSDQSPAVATHKEAVSAIGPTDVLTVLTTPGLTPDITKATVTKLDQLYRTGAKTVVGGTKKYLLAVLCTMKLKGSLREYESMQKKQLLDILQASRFAEGIIDEDGSLLDKNKSNYVVLGKETLNAIREDMESISLPSWFTRAPKHPGEIKWGKFKADEWKAFCMVNLPVTLTRLWGGTPKTGRQYKMLENFMHLVNAVKIANMRKITSHDIDLYETHMELYLRGFVELYPFISISPYQHLSLHFPAHLRRFGPTHSWRCFAFERYNGLIQGLPTNNKFGEMEKSKFIRFCRAQNLRTLYSEANLPAELHPIISICESRYKINIRGTHNEETGFHIKPKTGKVAAALLDKSSITMLQEWMAENDPSTIPVFIPSKYSALSYVEYFGQRFDSAAKANSNVLFRKGGSEAGSVAGRIVSVFSYATAKNGKEVTELFAVLREYAGLSEEESHLDYFRQLPAAAGYLVHDVLKDDQVLVRISDIMTHFASSPVSIPEIDGRCLQILPLRL